MAHFNLLIVNKIGQLMFERAFPEAAALNANDKILIASTFHVMYGLSAAATPNCQTQEGFEVIEAETFK